MPVLSATEPATARVRRWRTATVLGVVVAGLAIWVGTWIWFVHDPSIEGLVGVDVAEVVAPGPGTAALVRDPYTIYHDIDGCEAGPEACGRPAGDGAARERRAADRPAPHR